MQVRAGTELCGESRNRSSRGVGTLTATENTPLPSSLIFIRWSKFHVANL